MASKIWVGTSTPGDWSVAANWTPSGVPVNGDDVFFNDGSQNVTAGLDQSAVALTSLRIGSSYTGNVASSAAYLQIGATTFTFESGGQECWVQGALTTVNVVGGISSANMLQLKGDGGTLRAIGGSGTVTMASASTTLDELEVFGAPSITVTIPSGVTSLDNVQVDSGVISIGAAIGTKLTVIDGIVKITDSATVVLADVNGGVLDYKSSGTLTTLNIFAGKFTLENNVATSVTVSNATMYEGSTVNLQNGLDNVTMSAGMIRHGGAYFPPRGKIVTFA